MRLKKGIKNSMPKISKTSKVKKVVPKKKTSITKAKEVTVKKKTIKKTAPRKIIKKTASKKANKIVIDIISDDENKFSPYQEEVNEISKTKASTPVFSSWSDFDRKIKTVDILSEVEKDDFKEIEPEDREEYNKQKNFFSDWAVQNAPKEGEDKPSLAPKKSVGLYRRQAFFYLGATLILLIAVAYFFFVKLTILVTPQGEIVNDSVSFNITDTSAISTASSTTPSEITNKTINGNLQIQEISAEKIYQTSGDNVSGSSTTGTLTGTVTLINNSSRNQPLVATTRLLSVDGKLFRLKEMVNIPAGGTIAANVYADKPGADNTPDSTTKFTIPGLGTQDKIYAENYQIQTNKVIKQSDLDQAKKDISEVLDLKEKNELQASSTDQAIVYADTTGDVVTEFDSKVGDTKAEFTVKAKKNIVVATFSKDKVIELAKARLSLVISDDKQLSNFNTNQITYSLDNFNETTKTAEIKAYFTALMSLKSDSALIDRNKLVGLNEQQISQYLNTFPEVKDYQLEFWPSFIRTAPSLPDRINIQISNINN